MARPHRGRHPPSALFLKTPGALSPIAGTAVLSWEKHHARRHSHSTITVRRFGRGDLRWSDLGGLARVPRSVLRKF